MSTLLEIAFHTRTKPEEILEFFTTDEWNQETEQALFHKLHELICLLRPHANHLIIKCKAEVAHPESLSFLLKKSLNKPVGINTQKLSKREAEILGLIMQGLTNPEIAKRLFISIETVKSHRRHILIKTGARNTAALVTYYHHTFFDNQNL